LALLLGFDTGGTFTDAVLFDEAKGVVAKAKALTTKQDLAIGVGQAMDAVLKAHGLAGREREIALVSLSTTLATNALVESHGNPVGLLLLGYPPQALERAGLREALRGDPVAFLAGGHSAGGEPQAPLDKAAALEAVRAMAPRVQSFAVAGFFAVRNPAHELALSDWIRAETGMPVTCAHLLSSALDAPRRALTAVLNARLIPLITQLVEAVQGLMRARGLVCPLTVVKGDGSLISDRVALASPVETILSGPAASVVGARALAAGQAGAGDAFISDIGGTTTDIAVLHGGRPVLNREGATVGGFRTMVEAVAVHTLGLGGDSEVQAERPAMKGGGPLKVGPRRALPLALLAHQHPAVLDFLEAQLARPEPSPGDARFALRLRRLAANAPLKPAERLIWDRLAEGPQALESLAGDYLAQKSLQRLLDRGLAIVSTVTPSDAAHLLGRQAGWNAEAARLGCALLARQAGRDGAEQVAAEIFDRVAALSAEALVTAALAEEGGPPALTDGLGRLLLERALLERKGRPLVGARITLERPIIAIGAPAATYYPAVAERLGTPLLLPEHAEVCNAVGAVASGIVQRARLLITQPAEGKFRAHLPGGVRDFHDLELAAAATLAAAEAQARDLALAAGAGELRLETSRDDTVVEGPGGLRTFLESVIVATAAGRPRLAEHLG